MRKSVEVRLGPGGAAGSCDQLGSSPRKIVLLSADGFGTMAIQRQTGKGITRGLDAQRPIMEVDPLAPDRSHIGAALQIVERNTASAQPETVHSLCLEFAVG